MKKIISLALVLIVATPFGVFAETCTQPGGGVPFDSSFCDTVNPDGTAGGATGSSAPTNSAAAAQGVQCGSASSGGSVAGAAAGSGLGNISQIANCLSGSVRGGGSITSGASCLSGLLGGANSGMLNNFLGVIQNPSIGNITGLVNTLFPGIGQQIQQFGTQALNSVLGSLGLGNIGSSAIGSIASGITGGLGAGAGSAISGIAGGALGGIAGGLAGGLLGGAMKVPVTDDTTHEKQDRDDRNRAAEAEKEWKKKCVEDPAVDQLNKQASNEINAEVIRTGAQYVIQNYGTDSKTAQDYTSKKFVENLQKDTTQCATVKPVVERAVTALIEEGSKGTTGGQPAASTEDSSCAPPQNQNGWAKFIHDMNEKNRASAQVVKQWAKLGAEQKAAQKELEKQQQQGYKAKGTCPVDPANPNGARREGFPEECPADFRANTPGPDIAHAVQQATVDAPQQQLLNSKRVGETVNPQVAGTINQLLSTLMGFIGLSRGSSGGSSSYADQISGTTNAEAVTTVRSYLMGSIDANIQAEDQYQRILDGMVRTLNDTKTAYNAVKQCYVALSGRTVSGLSAADITARINQASSTVAYILDPQIESRTEEYSDSLAVIGELQRLRGEAATATEAGELNAISAAMDSLQAAGLTHNASDVNTLSDEATASGITLQAATVNAATQLTECQAL